jgi:hypothetical protein
LTPANPLRSIRIIQKVVAEIRVLASRAMKKVLVVAATLATLFVVGCSPQTALLESFLPEDTKIIVQRVARDIPIPENATVSLYGTVITGTGDNWVGRLELTDEQSPGELTRFYVNGADGAGWTLTTSTIARTITLNLERNGRKATILIDGARENTGGGFLGLGSGGEGRTRVTISVNHEGAVQDQTPFRIPLPGVGGAGASLSPALPPTAANTLATESALLGLIAVSGAIGNTTTAAIDSGAVTTPR